MLSFKSWINQVQYFRLDLRVVEIQLNQLTIYINIYPL